MKLIMPLSIILLFLLTVGSYFKMRSMSNRLEDSNLQNEKINQTTEIFLHSLINASINHINDEYILTSGDTLRTREIVKPCVFYLFSSEDCTSCVEENIFNLIELSQKFSSVDWYIITFKEKLQYLNSLSRSYSSDFLFFGYILNENQVPFSHYFLVTNRGLSNSFYPIRGFAEDTQKYLEYVVKHISSEL